MSRRQFFFQQDGATAHCTDMVMEWLKNKFRERIIFRRSGALAWPARSPDLSPLDYWFWSICLGELRRSPPSSLDDLQETINNFVQNLAREEIIRSARDVQIRAGACVQANGGTFEHRLKKFKRNVSREECLLHED